MFVREIEGVTTQISAQHKTSDTRVKPVAEQQISLRTWGDSTLAALTSNPQRLLLHSSMPPSLLLVFTCYCPASTPASLYHHTRLAVQFIQIVILLAKGDFNSLAPAL